MTKIITTAIFIERANKLHNNEFDYSKAIYSGHNKKLIIICRKHGDFIKTPNNHLKNKNSARCPECNRERLIEKMSIPFEIFIKRSIEKHNNKFDYSLSKDDYHCMESEIKIICNKHNFMFKQRAQSHVHGKGCPICARETTSNKLRMTKEEFVEKANKKHNNKFDYSLTDYKSFHSPVKIICPIHGLFEQEAATHLNNKYGCIKCSFDALSLKLRMTKEEFINKASEKHNNKYNYLLVEDFKNFHSKIKIICPIHGIFEQAVGNHLSGRGCRKCKLSFKRSGVSQKWLDVHKVLEENRESKITINNKIFYADGIDEINKIVLELLGDFWHGNPKFYKPNKIHPVKKCTYGELLQKTFDRFGILISAGYKILYIWESDFNKGNLSKEVLITSQEQLELIKLSHINT